MTRSTESKYQRDQNIRWKQEAGRIDEIIAENDTISARVGDSLAVACERLIKLDAHDKVAGVARVVSEEDEEQ